MDGGREGTFVRAGMKARPHLHLGVEGGGVVVAPSFTALDESRERRCTARRRSLSAPAVAT